MNQQSGVVSLFTVLFTTILLTVLTVGFLRLMVQEQRQALNNDLSQSAYDSAMSGVEDAKRALRACRTGNTSVCNKIDAQACNTIQSSGIVGSASDTEVTIRSGDLADTSLSQSYTCVTINRNSDDVIGNLPVDGSQIVPMHTDQQFDAIAIEWTHKGSQYSGGDVDAIQAPAGGGGVTLPPNTPAGWGKNAPAMLRIESVLPPDANSVTLADLDTQIVSTTFLRPTVAASQFAPTIAVGMPRAAQTMQPGSTLDTQTAAPAAVTCSSQLYTNNGYACKVILKLASGTTPAMSKVAFLRITSLYNETSFRIQPFDTVANKPVTFNDVQPVVDATGRAGNLYRRVVSRLSYQDLSSSVIPFPNSAVDITANLCKDFYVTDTTSDGNGCNTRLVP